MTDILDELPLDDAELVLDDENGRPCGMFRGKGGSVFRITLPVERRADGEYTDQFKEFVEKVRSAELVQVPADTPEGKWLTPNQRKAQEKPAPAKKTAAKKATPAPEPGGSDGVRDS